MKSISPKFTVIVINYNSAQCCVDLIEKWLEQGKLDNWEMIIVENGSPQQQTEIQKINRQIAASSAQQKIKLLVSPTNLGFGGGNNLAAQSANGEWLFFLNADTLVNQTILIALEQELKKIKQATGQWPAVLAPTLVLADGATKQEYAWGIFPDLNSLLRQNNKKNQAPTTSQSFFSVDWVSGAAFAITKKAFTVINGFDEQYFMYFEDVDLCKSVINAFPGQRIYVDTELKIVHLGGKSVKLNRQRFQLYFQAQNYYFQKHLGEPQTALMKIIRWPYKLWRLYFYNP